MAEEKEIKKNKSPLVGAQAKPTTLNDATKIDIDISKELIDAIISTGINGGLNTNAIENFTSVSNARNQMYQLIDTMMGDSTVSSIVRTYAEDVCETADNGHIVWCESEDQNISKFVNFILNVMNVDKNIFGWAYSLIEYGDVYLRLFRDSDYEDTLFNKNSIEQVYGARNVLNEDLHDVLEEGINLSLHNNNDKYSYYVEQIADPGTMFELTKYGKTYGYVETPNQENGLDQLSYYTGVNNLGVMNYKMKSNDVNIYQADDFVHGYLDDNRTRYPEKVELFLNEDDYKNGKNPKSYGVRRGKSLLIDSYKIWREKALLENSALLNRITRSSIVRNIQIEVGDMPKSQVQNTLRRIKDLFEQKSAINTDNSMSEYNNPGPIENNIFTATYNGKGAITVNQMGGDVNVRDLADLDWWNNKFYSSYGIPKQYFGWTDDGAGFNGGSSLTILSSVYSKGVKRVQNALIQMLTDAVNLFLINRGCRSYLNNFVLKMKTPLSQEEKDYRENLSSRIQAISSFNSLFTDIEDKARRLEILKDLVATLNYGDGIIEEINKEIEATLIAQKEEKEQAEADAAAEKELELAKVKANDKNEEDIDLNMNNIDLEAFNNNNSSTILTEDQEFSEDFDDLPTPEQADNTKDFTKNN